MTKSRLNPPPLLGIAFIILISLVSCTQVRFRPSYYTIFGMGDEQQEATFGIDYSRPNLYLQQGKQTKISNPDLINPLRIHAEGTKLFAYIYHWLHKEFTYYKACGKTIGEVTVDDILEDRCLGGCHDYGLVFAAAVRELGYPAVMVDSYSIAWIEKSQRGEAEKYVGHVFVEVYYKRAWVLIDPSNGWYVEKGYDPANPVIPLRGLIAGSSDETHGYYADRKGLDTWSCDIHNPTELALAMDALAATIDLATITYPEYEFKKFDK